MRITNSLFNYSLSSSSSYSESNTNQIDNSTHIMQRWTPPVQGFVKVNFDTAIDLNSNVVVSTLVLQDHNESFSWMPFMEFFK